MLGKPARKLTGGWTVAVLIVTALLIAACDLSGPSQPGLTATPTDTLLERRAPANPTAEPNPTQLARMLSAWGPPGSTSFPAGQIRFEHLTPEQGLASSSVYWITQDKLGFLWIGTSGGLNRYDGYNFELYQHDPDDPSSLSDDHVFHVLEDQQGNLWVATYGGGLERFDRDREQFIHYRFDPKDPNSLTHNKVYALYEDREGSLWVGTSGGGLDRYDPKIDGFVHYRHDPQDPDSLIDDYVNAIYQDRAGHLWIGTTQGLDRLDRESGGFVHYQHDTGDPNSLSDNQVFAILEDHLGVLWVGTSGGGLNRFVPETEQFLHFRHDPEDPDSLSDDVVFFLLEDRIGTLWAASLGGGLNQFDREKEQFVRHRNDPNDPFSLSSDSVNTMFEDREGTIWVGTTRGLDKYARQKYQFNRFLDYEFVSTILEDSKGRVWVGNTEGLYQLNGNLKEVAAYRHDPDGPGSLSRGWVLSLYEDRTNALWIGTSGGGLSRFDEETGQFEQYQHDPSDAQSLSNDVVNAIFQDPNGTFWIGTDGGLNLFDAEQKTFRVLPTDPANPDAARVESIDLILEDEQGRIWLGGWGDGLKRFDPATGALTVYRHESGDPQSLTTNFVTALYQDSDGNLWVGTDRGLHRYDPEIDGFYRYGTETGLQAESIGTIAEDANGDLWVGSSRGLARLEQGAQVFTNYSISRGALGGHFGSIACSRRNGEMLFGGADGVVVTDPDELWSNPYAPPIQFVSLRQSGIDVQLDHSLQNTHSVTLRWPDKDFEFEFTALSYVQPESNQFAYRLEGYEQGWNYIGSNRTGRYTSLPGGTYTLRIKGSNNDGVWNETGASLLITIVPPVWDTWWFRAIAVLGLAAGVFAVYQLRVRSIQARTRELERQVGARTRELATLNVIAQTVSQSLRLDAMLAASLDKVLQVLGFESGAIYLKHMATGRLQMASHRGLSKRFRQVVARGIVSAETAQSGRPVIIDDTPNSPQPPPEIAEEGYRSLVSIPLTSRGEVQGVLTAASRHVRQLRNEDVAMLVSIGHQIGVAIENARLYENTKSRLAQITALQETSTAVVSTLELDELLRLITEQATALLQAKGGILNLVNWEKGEDEAVACAGSAISGLGRCTDLQESLSGWISLHNQPVISTNVHLDGRVHRIGLTLLESELEKEIRNAAGAPLSIKDQVVGSLVVVDKMGGDGEFGQDDLDLLVAFANQAATAIENARLFEAEQRRAEQFRVITEVGHQITSILNIDDVLVQLTQLIQRSFDYDHVGIALIEGDAAVYKVGAGELWENHDFAFEPNPLRVGREGITGHVAATGEPVLVPDVSQESRYVWMQGSQTRSELTVPIKVKGEVIGVLDVQSNRLNAFDESDLRMLQSLANQAAVAIQNARLFAGEQRRAEQFRVISEVGSRVASILTVEELLDQMARLIQKAFDYYIVEIGMVEGRDLVFKTRAGRTADAPFEDFRLPLGQGSVTGRVAATGEPLLIPDVSQEPNYVRVTATDTRAELAVPMKAKERVIGVINVESERDGAFDESDLSVLQSLANQAAIGIENARLYEQAQKLAVVEERQRLARDLHDAVTQTLFSASLIAEALPILWESDQQEGRELLAELRQLSRGALAEMRTLLLELRPAALIESNLRDLLRQLGEAVAGRTGAKVQVAVDELGPLPDEVHVALYRIAQEALNNVVKHAQASQVMVRLRCLNSAAGDWQKPWIELRIQDDGRGFDPARIPPDRLGLGIIRERAQSIGAALDISSRLNRGTEVLVTWREET